jgi:Flp pilus assembly protein TadD
VGTHNNLAAALANHGRVDEAIAHYRKALKIQPDNVGAHYGLGGALQLRGRLDQAMAEYRKALELKPDYVEAFNNLAWMQATCAEASFRNGAEAVKFAERANQLCGGTRPDILDTLAAAYGEAGRFSEAIATARKALDLATQQHDQGSADALRARLTGYEAKKPYRQTRSDSMPRLPQP